MQSYQWNSFISIAVGTTNDPGADPVHRPLFFFPKSPRWLATKGRWDEARQVLADLHGKGDMSHPLVLAEFMEIEEQLRLEREDLKTSWAEMAQPKVAKRVFLGCAVQMFSQLTGMNVMSKVPTNILTPPI